MKTLKVIIILALLHLVISPALPGWGVSAGGGSAGPVATNCTVIQNGTVTCDIYCYICNNGTCEQCCSNYYLQNNSCAQCSDGNCLNCSATQCYACNTGFSPMTSDVSQCSSSSALTQINCRAVNNCTNLTCVNSYIYGMNNVGQCVRCYQLFRNCSACSNTRCYWCQGTNYLNATANYTQCASCNIPWCANCKYAQTCKACISGYYILNETTCKECRLPCLTCESADNCTSCNVSLQLYLINATCVPCNNIIASCSTCSSVVNSANVTCNACNNGTYLANSSCSECVSPCLYCLNQTNCLSCINSTYGYDSTNFLCQECSSLFNNCTTCSFSACFTCSVGFHLSGTCISCNITFPGCDTCNTLKCLTCLSGFEMLSNLTCVSSLCNAPCAICGTSQIFCLSCISGYYLSGSTCLPCVAPCKTCSSLSYCISCISNEMQYSSGTCIACLVGQRYNPFTLICQSCPINCLSCTWWNGCDSCTSLLYSVDKNICVDTCGDTFAFDLECDTTVGVANDGCTDSCTVQPNYNCTKALATATINGVSTSVNTSQCSYIGNISVSIASAVQSLFSNTLKLGFSVQPYLKGMPTNADSQTYLKSIFALSPLDTVAAYQVSVDQKLGIVYFSIDHNDDISALSPTLLINFAYLGSVDPMFQYTTNISYPSSQINQIISSGRLGEPQQESSLSLAKTVYGWSAALAVGSIFIMVFGVFGKELVGLDQTILCQHVFFLLLFDKGKLTLPLMALSGLRYSTGLHFEDSPIALSQGQSYVLQLDSSSFVYNFNLNLAVYALPLVVSFFILLYKLRYKHLPALRDLAQQTYEVIMGETILYLAMFNLSGLIAYAYLFYTSSKSMEYYDNAVVAIAVIVTLFALSNFFAKPEIVGMFRSAFKTESDERDNRRSKTMEKFLNCISKQCWREKLKSVYAKIAINFYLVYICYLAAFVCLAAFAPFQPITVILILQLLIFAVVASVRPHFNPFEKLRALLTWPTTILGTVAVAVRPKGFALPIFFLTLLTLHLVASILIIVHSIWQQIKRKCNDRSEVVKKLMKEGEASGEKDTLRELIFRYQNLSQNQSPSLNHQVEKIQLNFKQNLDQQYQRLEVGTPKGEVDEDKVQFQEQIIKEEHEHFRYQKGLQFFNKYANTIDLDLIKEYSEIQED